MSAREPFGYKYNENTQSKDTIPEQLEALEKAKYYLAQGCTVRSVTDWIVNKTGRSITPMGLLKTINHGKTLKKPT